MVERKKHMYFSSPQLVVAFIISYEAIIVGLMNEWANVWPRLLEGEVRQGKGAQKKNIIFFSTSLIPSKIRIHEGKKSHIVCYYRKKIP